MPDEEGFSWVFESLVQFLKGPIWEAAVLTFIEKKSVVFDYVDGGDEEYRKIHEEYKMLVGTLLCNHMEDLGFTIEDFKKACAETEGNILSQFQRNLFEQLFAAADYEIFERMMTLKNLELQLQVLDLQAYQNGKLPEFVLPREDYDPSPEEKSIMETVLRRYMEENAEESETDLQYEQNEVIQATKSQLEEKIQRERELMEKALETSLYDSPKSEFDNILEVAKITEMSEKKDKRSQEYLKQPRDKYLALKTEEREKLLQRYEASSRPGSVQAVLKMVTDEADEDESVDPNIYLWIESLSTRFKAEAADKKD